MVQLFLFCPGEDRDPAELSVKARVAVDLPVPHAANPLGQGFGIRPQALQGDMLKNSQF